MATPSTNHSCRSSGCPPPRCVAIFVGGALGTVARYLLEAHHPVAHGALSRGSRCWSTCPARSPSGCSCPLTEHVAHPCSACAPSSSSASSGGGRTVLDAGRRGHAAGQGRRHRHLRRLPGRHRRRRADPGRRSVMPSAGGWSRRERSSPTLGLALLVALPAARARSLRALLIHHVGVRAARPVAPRHDAGQRVGLPPPRRPDRAVPLPRPRVPTCSPSSGSGSAVGTPHGPPRAGRRFTCSTPATGRCAVVYTVGGLAVCLACRSRRHRRSRRCSVCSGLSPRRPRAAGSCRPGCGLRRPG